MVAGELGQVQADAAAARAPSLVAAAAAQPPRMQQRAARAHLENTVGAGFCLFLFVGFLGGC